MFDIRWPTETSFVCHRPSCFFDISRWECVLHVERPNSTSLSWPRQCYILVPSGSGKFDEPWNDKCGWAMLNVWVSQGLPKSYWTNSKSVVLRCERVLRNQGSYNATWARLRMRVSRAKPYLRTHFVPNDRLTWPSKRYLIGLSSPRNNFYLLETPKCDSNENHIVMIQNFE
jgi:hypothetical protein